MCGVVRFVLIASAGLLALKVGNAQIAQPIIPLQLDGDVRPTQLPPSALLGSPQCDSLGTVYVQYSTQANGSYASSVGKVEPDGSTETLPPPSLQGKENHVFIFAADQDGSLHEIVRAPAADARDGGSSSEVEYVRFDSDGSVRSQERFSQEFIPSAFLPLPTGNFFASGIVLKEERDGVSETAIAGIFDPNAQLQRALRDDTTAKIAGGDEDASDAFVHAETVRLGDDGNMYVLLGGDHAQVAVVSQSGRILRQMKLQEAFTADVASDMWVSGNRLLVVYEGEADDPHDSFVYVLYDAHSGEVIRQYRPDFLGTPACFQGGETLTLLLREAVSGSVGVATAELR